MNREPRTENREPRTENRTVRTKNSEEEPMPDLFVPAIAVCLRYAGGPSKDDLEKLVQSVLESPPAPKRADLMEMQRRIDALLPDGHDRIALVYGGATKIKGYVFEAPKLPEIRGASALLDWVNEIELPRIWGIDVTGLPEDKISQKLAASGIIYASGGEKFAVGAAVKRQRARATHLTNLTT